MKYIDVDLLRKEIERKIAQCSDWAEEEWEDDREYYHGAFGAFKNVMLILDSLQQEQQEVDLEKFTEKMDAWKARFNYPDNIPIKATMAFTARMFCMHPNVAREWYESLPKATQD